MAYTHTKLNRMTCAGSICALLALTAVPAFAGFELKGPQAIPPKVTEESLNPPSGTGPTQLTPAPAVIAKPDIVEGAGTHVPLRIAAMRIVPADKMVVFADGVDAAQPVSWSGGKPWHDVLSDVATSTGLSLDMSATTVTFVKPAAVVAAAVPAAPPAPLWEGAVGEHLQAVLQRWCDQQSEQSGKKVRLVWEAPSDYRLKAAAHISEPFEVAARMLLAGFREAPGKPGGLLNKNPVGESVLIVKARSKNYYGG